MRGNSHRRRAAHRRRSGLRGRRLSLLMSGFLLIGLCVAAGVAWDPFRSGAGTGDAAGPDIVEPRAVQGGSGPEASAGATPGATSRATASPSAPEEKAVAGRQPGDAAEGGKRDTDEDAQKVRRTGPMPFDLPSPAALKASGKLVFAHYFTPYPLSLDNARPDRDYYSRNYLTPEGEKGKHEEYGGLLRDRPLPVEPRGGNWELANLRQEVRTARDAGLDGFTLDMLSLEGKNRERCELLLQAARSVDPDFTIMLMPDMTSLKTDDPDILADAVAALGASPAAHRLGDGRLVVSPFKAEEKSPGWWSRMLKSLEARHGIRTAFVPLFLDFDAHHEQFAPLSYGYSEWGSRSYVGQQGAARDVRRAHEAGKIWMQPVSVQDTRPNQGVYDEAGNTATLRTTWNRAIADGADWVQLTTWNDYSEGTHFAPSLHNGHTYLDLTSYYLTRFKTGAWPKIVRDTLYLTSRTQFAGARPTGGQSRVMSLRKGSAAARDTVEVLSFLTDRASVRTQVGAADSAYDAPAGVHAELLPLRAGTSSAQAVRGGRTTAQVELPYAVEHRVEVQDLQYYGATSGRDAPACC
ncbi:glycoside hydrolase family 71 protein [Streptomyces sp. MUM 178J]|uniref:glycoside hydrolase family 71 protein n=1 Tax=Streptomyces sp. MUM 178J TaxID=2791991 RepID=UPI001F04A39F|nr:glycoside hydrolase family 71 protein [Streptomyces sp. MUM 178J]WRQ78013.1 glycoside hydrolase family 71 protein [Streptomyces sp. MUM 178J]